MALSMCHKPLNLSMAPLTSIVEHVSAVRVDSIFLMPIVREGHEKSREVSIRASNVCCRASVSVWSVLVGRAGLAPLAKPRIGLSNRGAFGPWRPSSRRDARFGLEKEKAGEVKDTGVAMVEDPLMPNLDVGLVGVSSTVNTCPDRLWREFRGYLSKSAGRADWSLGIVCRRLVQVSRSIALTDLTTMYELVVYAD
ncbi:hypothetical protein L3X38_027211 [Prunus dulcis]|uniref:Uncharacterized protein n=1 Tax=Prunus dulcis TaxID=3755 RepID=A0AAD4VMH5_PRUDU|nr:hypothetical protein L3X38_027211 [Prunus dulcis]